jgi:hypothetical protein
VLGARPPIAVVADQTGTSTIPRQTVFFLPDLADASIMVAQAIVI